MATNTNKLTADDYRRAAARLQVDVAAIKAVDIVESSGGGFLEDGRVKVNYEPHVMYRQLKKNFNKERADAELERHPDLVSNTAGHRHGPNKEDSDLDRATLIDRHSALESASWGKYQIMGYHWKTVGYSGVQEFINMMYSGEAGQLEVFIRFIEADPALHLSLKRQDWKTFARIYNGPAYAKNKYPEKLETAFNRNRA